MTFLPPFPSAPCPAYYISLSIDVQSVVSFDPSALVSCSCFLACFAPLLFLFVPELQKTQHQLVQCAETELLKKQIRFLVLVSQTPFFSFISSETASFCCSVLRHLCHEPPCHSCFQPVILDPAIHGRFLSLRVFPLLDLQDLRNTQPELLCFLGVRCGFAEPCFRITSAHPLTTNVFP